MTKKQIITKLLGKAYYPEADFPANKDITYYYPIELICSNCGQVNKVVIKKGKYVKDVSPIVRCSNCKTTMKNCTCNVCS
jgi:lysyl-tRNA synthetase class I